jgi:hypothetical protein
MDAALIVTIDTEEEGLWSGQFDPATATVRNIAGVPRFQQVCDAFGLAPTYLVNSPVATSAEAVAVLREIQDSGRCEIGAHIHPWNTPPGSGSYDARASYLNNLPLALQREKLAVVTDQITQAFGVAPRSFRSGRYGLDGAGAALLPALGYMVDSSVCPFTDYSADGGPDFRGAPWTPYWLDGGDIRQPAARRGSLLEVPVSFGFDRSQFALAEAIHGRLARGALSRLRAVGVLDRLRLLRKIKFSPEKGDAPRLNALARAYAHNGAPCMVMMFHSSSLLPGQTPYVRDARQLEAFLDTLRGVFEYCLGELGMRPMTLAGFADAYAVANPGAE